MNFHISPSGCFVLDFCFMGFDDNYAVPFPGDPAS
jgi:hypothetical protein